MDKVVPGLRIFLILTFSSFLIFIFDFFNLLDIPKKISFYVTNPISFGVYKTNQNVSRQFYFIFASRKASQENKALQEQLGQLLSENANLNRQLAQSQAMVSQFQHLDPKTYNLIAAHPVGLSRYLKIDKGSDSGIKIGEAVVFEENFVGKVTKVERSGATVQTLMDPDSKIAAFSQGLEGRAKGVLLGQFGTDLLMDKILHEEQVKVGDLVYSEGTEGYLPRGLILGKVIQVMDRQNEVFKQAKVKPVFDIGDLDLVFVIEE